MSFIDSLRQYFSKGPQEVYCQICSKDLTDLGGYVMNDSSIYCVRAENYLSTPCATSASLQFSLEKGFAAGEFHNSKQVQRAIRKGTLRNYSSIEDSL